MIVSMQECKEYDVDAIMSVIDNGITQLGGWDQFFSAGDRVLLKPNLLSKHRPEDAVTTHPAVIQALAALLIQRGCTVVIGDSPGGPFSKGLLNSIYRGTGMADAATASGAALNNNFKSYVKENPQGLLMKKLTLVDMLNDVDKVVCVAKLKTHGMMTYTGAVKNMFGMVPGIAKAEYHLNMPDYNDFADALIDICIATAPTLSIIDGIVGMEGNGPAAGTPIHTGALLMSASPYHLDMAACRLIGLVEDDVPLLRRLKDRGMAQWDEIEFVGAGYEAFSRTPYEFPPQTIFNMNNPSIPRFVRSFVARFVQTRPRVAKAGCNGCGICKEACPAKVITIAERAVINLVGCIRCYCCQELCPQKAISIKKPFLSRILRW